MNPTDTDQVPLSEVGSDGQPSLSDGAIPSNVASGPELLSNMETLLTRLLSIPTPVQGQSNVTLSGTSSTPIKFVRFDPDDADSDIEGWCRLTEMIVKSKNLDGVDLLMSLTAALKGRAATFLTKLSSSDVTWAKIQEKLVAKFSKPKLIQDYFDDVLKFNIETKETACEAAARLWELVEKIPTEMTEEIITGFVISVLCNKEGNFIRRELNSHTITTRAQLFRVLRGVSVKRGAVEHEHESNIKRARPTEPRFNGKCHYCGLLGHRQSECRKKIRDAERNDPDMRQDPQKNTVTCFLCKKPGHISSSCPDRRARESLPVVKEVNLCTQKISKGSLETSKGENLVYLFDSGSSCSLLRNCVIHQFSGDIKECLVYLNGIGSEYVVCTSQIFSNVKIDNISFSLLFYIVPDNCISESVIIGRDILQHNVQVCINQDNLTFKPTDQIVSLCEERLNPLDPTQIDTDVQGTLKTSLLNTINKYSEYFTDGTPSRRVTTGSLEINLIDPHKIVQRSPYRLSPSEKQIVRDKIRELLEAQVIRESSSPFASPILLVKKKDNTDRMCVDFRELNANTRPEHYPLPRIDEQIDHLAGAYYFSSLDMASGFHQIPIHPDSIEKTAFVTPEGQYEYLAMPFGLRNAPSVYQRSINKALNVLEDKPLVYMDDVLCFSASAEMGLIQLDHTLQALTQSGFSLNIRKCKFLKQRVDYLGYSIQAGEVRPNQRKIQALTDAPPPKTATQVRQFLGLASYFRRFIPQFSCLLSPIYPLTRLKGPIKWLPDHEVVRQKVISILTSEPVLKIFDPKLPVELHTDASSDGYGAILIQKKESLPYVIAYYSRRTTEVESRYHSYELETLAVVRAVEHFRHYLYGRHFVVFTDCNSLKASKSKTDLTPRVHRWWAYLQAYDFDIEYRPGHGMGHADYLSRNPLPGDTDSASSPKCTVTRAVNFVELHEGWLKVEQNRDSEIQDLITKHGNGEIPESIQHTYDVRNGILYRKVERNRITSWLPIVPRSLIWTLINQVHTEIQHLGPEKTLDKLYEKYWFPEMCKRVRQFIDSCIVCKTSKGPSGASAIQLHPIDRVPLPWHTVHIDFSGKLSGKSGQKEYCSVIIDYFSKYVLLEHTTSLDALSAIKAIKRAVSLFGAPKRIIADQGRCYVSADFKKFCSEHKIDLHYIATGSSRANGQVERVMRTLKSILTIVENDCNKTWRDELDSVQLALNSTKSRVTGYTPTELMFGTRADSLGLSKIRPGLESQNRENLDEIRADALENIKKSSISETERFNRGKAKVKPFVKGDFVFIKSSERNQTKLDKKFKGPFVISEVLENDRYELKSLSGTQRSYKYAHEDLRAVPRGSEGLIEIASSLLSDDEVNEHNNEQVINTDDDNIIYVDIPSISSDDTLTAGPTILRTDSDMLDSDVMDDNYLNYEQDGLHEQDQ